MASIQTCLYLTLLLLVSTQFATSKSVDEKFMDSYERRSLFKRDANGESKDEEATTVALADPTESTIDTKETETKETDSADGMTAATIVPSDEEATATVTNDEDAATVKPLSEAQDRNENDNNPDDENATSDKTPLVLDRLTPPEKDLPPTGLPNQPSSNLVPSSKTNCLPPSFIGLVPPQQQIPASFPAPWALIPTSPSSNGYHYPSGSQGPPQIPAQVPFGSFVPQNSDSYGYPHLLGPYEYPLPSGTFEYPIPPSAQVPSVPFNQPRPSGPSQSGPYDYPHPSGPAFSDNKVSTSTSHNNGGFASASASASSNGLGGSVSTSTSPGGSHSVSFDSRGGFPNVQPSGSYGGPSYPIGGSGPFPNRGNSVSSSSSSHSGPDGTFVSTTNSANGQPQSIGIRGSFGPGNEPQNIGIRGSFGGDDQSVAIGVDGNTPPSGIPSYPPPGNLGFGYPAVGPYAPNPFVNNPYNNVNSYANPIDIQNIFQQYFAALQAQQEAFQRQLQAQIQAQQQAGGTFASGGAFIINDQGVIDPNAQAYVNTRSSPNYASTSTSIDSRSGFGSTKSSVSAFPFSNKKDSKRIWDQANRVDSNFNIPNGVPSNGPQSAVASGSIGPQGGYRTGQISPASPGIFSRFGEDIPPPSGGNYGVFSSSSSSSATGPDGKTVSRKTATVGVNDNGKVSYKTVHDP